MQSISIHYFHVSFYRSPFNLITFNNNRILAARFRWMNMKLCEIYENCIRMNWNQKTAWSSTSVARPNEARTQQNGNIDSLAILHFIFMPTQNNIGITKCDAISMLSDTDEIAANCCLLVVHDDSNNGHASPFFCIANAVNWTYVGAKKENLEKIIHSHVYVCRFAVREEMNELLNCCSFVGCKLMLKDPTLGRWNQLSKSVFCEHASAYFHRLAFGSIAGPTVWQLFASYFWSLNSNCYQVRGCSRAMKSGVQKMRVKWSRVMICLMKYICLKR